MAPSSLIFLRRGGSSSQPTAPSGRMGTMAGGASKKRMPLWEKALFHFAFCFAMGFFSGFTSPSPSSSHRPQSLPITHLQALPRPNLNLRLPNPIPSSLLPPLDADLADDDRPESNPPRLIITVTTGPHLHQADLLRLAATLRLVRPPLLWLVVGGNATATAGIARALRGTAVMHRHLTYKENFTGGAEETHHQRNVALGHVERHRLSGILHFAGAGAAYDLQFFEEIRQIDTFGTWPVATLSAEGRRSFAIIEGPVCSGRRVVGWFSHELTNGTTDAVAYTNDADVNSVESGSGERRHLGLNFSGVAFNTSMLWDPERWGRPVSLPDTSQDSMKFVNDMIQEDRGKLKGIPSDCSQILQWQQKIPPRGLKQKDIR